MKGPSARHHLKTMRNPRTTILGWLVLVSALLGAVMAFIDGDPSTNPNFEAIMAALAGVGLITAKDGNK